MFTTVMWNDVPNDRVKEFQTKLIDYLTTPKDDLLGKIGDKNHRHLRF